MEVLNDPFGDRPVKSHPPPPSRPLDHKLLFPEALKQGSKEIPDWKILKDHLSAEGFVNKADVV